MQNDPTIIRSETSAYSLKNTKTGEVFLIKGNTSIGRQTGCDIVLLEGHASRLHATVSIEGLSLLVKDQNSSNGTFLNGEKISEATLKQGDVLRFDIHEFLVLVEETKQNLHEASTQLRSVQENDAEVLLDLSTEKTINENPGHTLVHNEANQTPGDSSPKVNDASHFSKSGPETPSSYLAPKSQERTAIWKPSEQTDSGTVLLDSEKIIAQPSTIPIQHLYGYNSDIKGKKFTLKKDKMILGKSSLSDIIIKDSSISSQHAEISFDKNQWSLADLNSTNGSYINNDRVKHKTLLHPGDLLQFGVVQLVFAQELPASDSASRFPQPLKVGISLLLIISFIFSVAYFLKDKFNLYSSSYQWTSTAPAADSYRIVNTYDEKSILLYSLSALYDFDSNTGKTLFHQNISNGICTAQKVNGQYYVLNFKGKLESLTNHSQFHLNTLGMVSICHLLPMNESGITKLLITYNGGEALFDPAQNAVLWELNTELASVTFSSLALTLENGQSLSVLAGLDGIIRAKALQGNRLINAWSAPLDRAKGPYLVNGNEKFIVAYNPSGTIYAIDSNSGALIWHKILPFSITSISVTTENIYLSSQNQINQLAINTGENLNQLPSNKKVYGIQASRNGDVIAITEGPEFIRMDYKLQVKNHDSLREINTPHTLSSSETSLTMIDSDGQVLFFE